MREILFRGKRVDNGEWVYGDFIENQGSCYIYTASDTTTIPIPSNEQIISVICNKIIPETVGQYTGLTDKNGKKIFEGDYVINIIDEGSKEETVCVEYVGFYDGSFGFFDHIVGDSSPYPNDCFTPFEYCVLENIDFCGNIHDNPELLKGGDENA